MKRPASEDQRPLARRERRGLVPDFASGSLWTASAWTGAACAAVATVLGIIAAAVLWLPVSGSNGSVGAAARAGTLTFLTALHGGVVIDGAATGFVPLGMTLIVACLLHRFGVGLADVAVELAEQTPERLAGAAAVQALSFAVVTLVVDLAAGSLGTSHAPPLTAMLAALLLAAVAATAGLARTTALGTAVADRLGQSGVRWLRGSAVVVSVYLASAAVLTAGSLLVHHRQAEAISSQVGGGLSGIPVLLIGVLAAPNVVVGAVGYLAGPGVSVGTGTHFALGSTAHGVLPAFPPLAVAPDGGSVPVAGWMFAVITPFLAAGLLRRSAAGRGRGLVGTLAFSALAVAALAWLSGGGIGSGRLRTVGVSPWQAALAVAAEVGVAATLLAVTSWVRAALAGRDEPELDEVVPRPVRSRPAGARIDPETDRTGEHLPPDAEVVGTPEPEASAEDPDGTDELAS